MTINKYLYFLGLLGIILILPLTISGADLNDSSINVVNSYSDDSMNCNTLDTSVSLSKTNYVSENSNEFNNSNFNYCGGISLDSNSNENTNYKIDFNDSVSIYSSESNIKYVSLNGSDSNDGNTIATAYKSINFALANSLENGTIYINDGQYVNNQGFTGLEIDKSITLSAINYGNVYIDCFDSSRFVDSITNYKYLTLIGLNILNGNGNYGGAIFSGSNEKGNAYIKIINGSFYNNLGGIAGGAIYIFDGSVEVINSSFYNNSANRAGAIYVYDGNLILKNSSFYNNLATVYGGAVLWANEKTDVFVDSSEFYNNFAFVDGGVINSYLGDITISNSNFHDNIAKRYGGAISNKEGSITINSSKFINNSGSEGGAIYHYSNSLATINNSIFYNNSAISSNGGIIYLYQDNLAIFTSVLISNGKNSIYSCNNFNLANVENNWWGNNLTNKLNPNDLVYNIPTINNYLLFSLSEIANGIYKGDINYNQNNEFLNLNNLIDIPISFSSNGGVPNILNDYLKEGSIEGIVSNGSNLIANIFGVSNTIEINNSKLLSILTANNMTTNINSNESLYFSLKDNYNHVLTNKTIKLTLINSLGQNCTYLKTSDENGLISLNINLMGGEYKILAIFEGDGNYDSSELAIFVNVKDNRSSSLMLANNYTNVYGVNGNFTTKLTDSNNNNPLVGKECCLLLKNIFNKTKLYWSTTNTEGIAKLAIHLIPANWTITSYYLGDTQYSPSNYSEGTIVIIV